jgi:hypothetical protein
VTLNPIPPTLCGSVNSALPRLFASSPIRSLLIDGGHAHDLVYCEELSLTNFQDGYFHYDECDPPPLKMAFWEDSFGTAQRDASTRESLYACIPLSRLSILYIEDIGNWSSHLKDAIQRSFGSLLELHTASLCTHRMVFDMLAVLLQTDPMVVDDETTILFPAVRTLWISFWSERWTTIPSPPAYSDLPLVEVTHVC